MADKLDLILADLIDAYPRVNFTEANRRLYRKFLADLNLDMLRGVIDYLVSTSRWMPTIAEIRNLYTEVDLGLAKPYEALEILDKIGGEMVWHDVPRMVQESIRSCGGLSAYRATERPDLWRRNFVEQYEEMRRDAITSAQRTMTLKLIEA
jgi:hypothetical protein